MPWLWHEKCCLQRKYVTTALIRNWTLAIPVKANDWTLAAYQRPWHTTQVLRPRFWYQKQAPETLPAFHAFWYQFLVSGVHNLDTRFWWPVICDLVDMRGVYSRSFSLDCLAFSYARAIVAYFRGRHRFSCHNLHINNSVNAKCTSSSAPVIGHKVWA